MSIIMNIHEYLGYYLLFVDWLWHGGVLFVRMDTDKPFSFLLTHMCVGIDV